MRHFILFVMLSCIALPSYAAAGWESIVGVQAYTGDSTYTQLRSIRISRGSPMRLSLSNKVEESGAGAGLYLQNNYVFDSHFVLGSELSASIGEYDNNNLAPIDVLVRIGYDIGKALSFRPFAAFGASVMLTDSDLNIKSDYIIGFKAGAGLSIILGFIVIEAGYYYAHYPDKELDGIDPREGMNLEANIKQHNGRIGVGLRF